MRLPLALLLALSVGPVSFAQDDSADSSDTEIVPGDGAAGQAGDAGGAPSCGCQPGVAPSGGWPLALLVVAATRRREP